MDMNTVFLPGGTYTCNLNAPNSEISINYIYEKDIEILRNAEDNIEYLKHNADEIVLRVIYKSQSIAPIDELFVLEENYIIRFIYCKSGDETERYTPKNIYKVTSDLQAKLSLLQCRNKLTQSQLHQLTLQCEPII